MPAVSLPSLHVSGLDVWFGAELELRDVDPVSD
jgi:hypothetical protein